MVFPIVMVLLGGFCLWRAWLALATGTTNIRFAVYRRDLNPIVFWFSVISNLVFGVLLLTVGLAGLLFPEWRKE